MPTSIVALQILLILLPGFAAAYIVQLLALRGSQTDFDKVIEASLYSLLIYSAFMVANSGALPFDLAPPKLPGTETLIVWHPKQLLALAAIALGFALAATSYINLDGNRIFRWLKLTERTSRRSIWNDIFQAEAKQDQVVQVELEGGRSLIGLLSYYSDAAEECSIYLKQASWVDDNQNTIPILGPGILITGNSKIRSISFLDRP